jgi:hypothetical protein
MRSAPRPLKATEVPGGSDLTRYAPARGLRVHGTKADPRYAKSVKKDGSAAPAFGYGSRTTSLTQLTSAFLPIAVVSRSRITIRGGELKSGVRA